MRHPRKDDRSRNDSQTRFGTLAGYRALVFLFALSAYALIVHHPDALPGQAASDVLARLAPRTPRPDVVVVALDDASVKQYGPIKSWSRSLLAQGIRHIESGGAEVVVMDLALDKRHPSGDDALWRTMADHRNVVLGMAYNAQRPQVYTPDDIRSLVFLERDAIADNLSLGPQTQVFPYALFEPPVSDFTGSAVGVGVFDRETDTDGVVRSARLFYTSTVHYPPTTAKLPGKFPQSRLADGAPVALSNLALVAALRIFSLDKSSVRVATGDTVRLAGTAAVPVDAQGRIWIRYAYPATASPPYSFRDIVTGKSKTDFRQKIVLIGATAAGDAATDPTTTPFGRQPRVFVTAAALSTLLDRSTVEVVARHPSHLIGTLLLLGLATGLCLMFVSGGRSLLITLAVLLVYLGLCWYTFSSGHLLLPILPGVAVILLTYLFSLALSLGPFRPIEAGPSPTYVPPPTEARRD